MLRAADFCSTWFGDSFDINDISIASETLVKADWLVPNLH